MKSARVVQVAAARAELSMTKLRAESQQGPGAESGAVMYAVTDERTGQRVRLDPLGAAALAALERPLTIPTLHASVQKRFPRPVALGDVYRRVLILNQNYLLEGPRSARFVALAKSARASETPREERTLHFHPELKHACQACGGCCAATDVGPLPAATVQAIAEHNWSAHIPALAEGRAAGVFREEMLRGESIWLTNVVDGACIFLREDKLCRVHAELGEAVKPTICKQFPYHFTALPDGTVAVSIQMECRSWLKAKRAAPATDQKEGELRQLLAQGAFVQTVKEPLELEPGVPVSWREAEGLRSELESALEGGADGLGQRWVSALKRAVTNVCAPFMAAEGYVERAAWVDAGAQPPAQVSIAEVAARLQAELLEAVHRGAEDHAQRGDLPRAAMHRAFAAMVAGVCAGQVDARRFRQPDGGLEEVLVDNARSALAAQDAWFQSDLAAGLAQLRFRQLLIEMGAIQRAESAARVEILAQDAIDSMVVANKMLRQWTVSALLRARGPALRQLWVG